MITLSEEFIPINVDLTDGANEVSRKYRVSGIPDVRFLKPDGTPIGKLEDRSPEGVVRQMRSALAAGN